MQSLYVNLKGVCQELSLNTRILRMLILKTSAHLLLDRVPCQAKRCKLRKFSDRMGYTYVYSKHLEMQTRLKWVSALYVFCENEAHIKHLCICTRILPLCQVISSWCKQTEKIIAFRKRIHCGSCALEVTNLNAVASNLSRTCSKIQSLPNSVIFITELHLHVFLALCSRSNSGKSLWTWRKTSEARSTRSSLDHKSYIPNCRD